MRKTNLDKIKHDLEHGLKGTRPTRFGIEYAWYNAGALDEGIRTRARKARKWRKAVLELAEEGTVHEEKVKIKPHYIRATHRTTVKATAYIVNGIDRLYISRGRIYETSNYERV